MQQTLGQRIAMHRKRLNLTQDQLADQLGITAQAVSKWEHDLSCPDITMLPRLAAIFQVSIDELLDHQTPEKVHKAEVIFEETTDDDEDEKDNDRVVVRWSAGKRGAMIFAFLVLALGLLMLLSRIYQWDVSFWSLLWPCAMIAYCVDHLLKRFSIFTLAGAALGGYFLVNNLGIWQFGISSDLYWPIVVVVIGLGLLADAIHRPKKSGFRVMRTGKKNKKTESKCTITNATFDCNLTFGERTHMINSSCLRNGQASVSFGEMVLDLTQVEALDEKCTIQTNCAFGELTLLVPSRFRVEQDVASSFASCDIKGYPNDEPEGVIQLDASVSFGSIVIKYV